VSPGAILVYMDILKMLADLREEREQIEQAILVIERMASARGKRRGRPPAWMKTRRLRSGGVGLRGARTSQLPQRRDSIVQPCCASQSRLSDF
jgi:hypothetical protein